VTAPFHPPGVEALPTEFAVFPLPGALLLPRARLPLNMFEPRYLAMVEDALAAGRMFGMIQPDARLPPVADGPALYRVGCLGRITSFSETEDGRFLITLTGLARFAVARELPPRGGYRRVAAGFAGFAADLGPGPDESCGGRDELLAGLRAYFAHRGFEANWSAIEAMADAELVNTLCMVCPFDPLEKQALLEAPGAAERSAALLALLQIGTHDRDDGAPGRSVS
jgi:Lon protease-like protein